MTRKGDIAIATAVILIVCIFMALTTGCEESQQRPTWGNGNPPAAWQETFGNDNGARIDFVQMRMLSEQAARIKVLEEFCRIDNGADTEKSR